MVQLWDETDSKCVSANTQNTSMGVCSRNTGRHEDYLGTKHKSSDDGKCKCYSNEFRNFGMPRRFIFWHLWAAAGLLLLLIFWVLALAGFSDRRTSGEVETQAWPLRRGEGRDGDNRPCPPASGILCVCVSRSLFYSRLLSY